MASLKLSGFSMLTMWPASLIDTFFDPRMPLSSVSIVAFRSGVRLGPL